MTSLPYWLNPLTGDTELLPLIVGMDPGAQKGYALVDPDPRFLHQHRRASIVAPSVLAIGTEVAQIRDVALSHGRPIWSMVELQYVQRVTSGEISALAIVRLAFRAGFMLRDADTVLAGARTFAAVPIGEWGWKEKIFAGGAGRVRKDIFTERLKRQLTPREAGLLRDLKQDLVDDVLDAIGIAWALSNALKHPATLEKWHVNASHMLPVAEKQSRKITQFRKALINERDEPND